MSNLTSVLKEVAGLQEDKQAASRVAQRKRGAQAGKCRAKAGQGDAQGWRTKRSIRNRERSIDDREVERSAV